MTPLGLGPEHCREALERYREGVAALAGLLGVPQQAGPGNATLAALDDLVNRLAVDSLSRRGSKGSQRMSQVEVEVFTRSGVSPPPRCALSRTCSLSIQGRTVGFQSSPFFMTFPI